MSILFLFSWHSLIYYMLVHTLPQYFCHFTGLYNIIVESSWFIWHCAQRREKEKKEHPKCHILGYLFLFCTDCLYLRWDGGYWQNQKNGWCAEGRGEVGEWVVDNCVAVLMEMIMESTFVKNSQTTTDRNNSKTQCLQPDVGAWPLLTGGKPNVNQSRKQENLGSPSSFFSLCLLYNTRSKY